jgi:hypothetical protein
MNPTVIQFESTWAVQLPIGKIIVASQDEAEKLAAILMERESETDPATHSERT